MNAKRNVSRIWLWVVLALILLVPGGIFLAKRLEGQPPTVTLETASASLGASQTLSLRVADAQSGIREVWVGILKDGKESVLVEKTFPSAGFVAGGQVHEEILQIPFEPKTYQIKDGKAVLRLVARDYAWRKWGRGNQYYQEQEVIIDTEPPGINVLSRAHYLAQGGAGVVIYKLSENCSASGVMVGDHFYPGFGGHFTDETIQLAFIAVDYRQDTNTTVSVTATDLAGNQSKVGLAHHINRRRFKQDVIAISDQFLNWKMPEFQTDVAASTGASPLDIFLKVNQQLRSANYEALTKIIAQTDKRLYWQGEFLRLPNAANKAGFAEHRTYTYKGKTIDKQTHLGIDLASLEQSPVPVANSGKVVFADRLGIYGRTIVVDHGFGLFSMYAHLSQIDVSPDQMVSKGEIIAKTGNSGLAGGDHLHFSMLVHHTFVNPLEWWDPNWIQNNIGTKIESIQ